MSFQSYEDDETTIFKPDELYSWRTLRSAVFNKIGKLLSASLWNKLRNKMIMISCVIAISLDPLFLYIPFIDEEKKCLGIDKKLRNVALILRSLTDITFLVHIGYQIYEDSNKAYKEINRAKSQWELDWQTTPIRKDEIVPFAAILATTLPWGSLLIDLLSVFPTPQVLGAFWYFFPFNERPHVGIGLVKNVPDNTKPPFDYGIFLDSLKLGNMGHFPTKLCYSFWWGLKNLSNFGTNLTTSNYVWENLFAILISITGVLLSVCLIGNVQVELLKFMNDRVLKMMCDCLTPVTYAPDHIIFRMGDPIDRMLLIIEGTVLTYSLSLTRDEETTKDSGVAPSPSMATKKLERGDVYGEELLKWASPNKNWD
ncbi:unnamed protein product [Prunus armeniaca]|uniref:Cyclic nucleotide-binding domain-containing protein n=1 Tax=Prunus armeniaca TaxID=36596 RepID=A0A6J5X851_PRUAR|nr:unnamed protein product [Prunus armeniaca]